MKKGKLLIVSGFSGVGKGTVVNSLKEKYSNYRVSVSATTRSPRENEIEGVHYFYKTSEEFKNMIENNQLLEYADYVKHCYGTPREFVESNLDNGVNVILEIETKGALQVKEKMPEALMIFILPPDAETLRQRLIGRNTETEEVIAARLEKAAEETEAMEYYEYFVINDVVENCVENINKIITNNGPDLPEKDRVQEIKNDILRFSKGE